MDIRVRKYTHVTGPQTLPRACILVSREEKRGERSQDACYTDRERVRARARERERKRERECVSVRERERDREEANGIDRGWLGGERQRRR